MGQFKCMNTKHLKSPCCQGKIYRFGQRRRRCSICLKTWRIRIKKRGRKAKRTNDFLARKYLANGGFNLDNHAVRLGISVSALHYRIRKSLTKFLEKTKWPKPANKGKLIAIADAVISKVEKQQYTTYIILLRSINGARAIITKPLTLPGYENSSDWLNAFYGIPEKHRNRITALVCDGKPCFKGISRRFDWFLQRCHFHLLAELYRGVSFKRRSQHKEIIKILIDLAKYIITAKDERSASQSVERMTGFKNNPVVPERIRRRFVSAFCRNYKLYRTYLYHPELKLPTTTGSCEATVKFIRKQLSRSNGFKTVNAYSRWLKAILLFRKNVLCERAKFQPKK